MLGVHLGIRHLADGSAYSPEAFGAALAAVRDEDAFPSVPPEGDEGGGAEGFSCPESLETLRAYQSSGASQTAGLRAESGLLR